MDSLHPVPRTLIIVVMMEMRHLSVQRMQTKTWIPKRMVVIQKRRPVKMTEMIKVTAIVLMRVRAVWERYWEVMGQILIATKI